MSAGGARSVTLAFLGDVMLGRLVSEELGRHAPEWFWGDVLPILRSADGVFINLECAITRHPTPWRPTEKVFHFRAEPAAVDVLQAANVRFASLANNHVLDYEIEGLLETIELLDKAGIAHAGAGRTRADAEAPAWVKIGTTAIALIAVTDNEPPFAAGAQRPGTYYLDLDERPELLPPTEPQIKSLRETGADFIVLSAHLGPNMVVHPSERIARYVAATADRGVNLVHGHSAHVFQGIERRGSSLILHDAGDFLDDYAVDAELRNDWSFVFRLEVTARGISRLQLLPVRLEFAQVRLATGAEKREICERMRKLSADLGTTLSPIEEGLELDLSSA